MKQQDKSIPEQIQDLLKNSGKTRYRLAKESGIRASVLQRVESPEWGTQFATAAKILKPLGYKLTITPIEE